MKTPHNKFDPVTVIGNTYGQFQFFEYLPRTKPALCRVLHSSNNDFSFALIKTFQVSAVKAKAAP
jgi:hypothetical protein